MLQILDFTEARLATVTARSQKHGDDEVPAVSLGLELTVANTLLDTIDPMIRHTLFKRQDGQDDLPGIEASTPVLRCNSIDSVKLPTKYEGWTLEADDGIDDTQPLVFGGVKVDKFSVEPKQGGSCVLKMRVGTSDLDAERSGFVGMHVGQSIWIKLRAPEKAPDAPESEGSPEKPDATDLFVAGAQDDGDVVDADIFPDRPEEPAEAAATREDIFPAQPSTATVTTRRRRKLGAGLGTDADQAARQAEVLAQDKSQNWPFPTEAMPVAETGVAP